MENQEIIIQKEIKNGVTITEAWSNSLSLYVYLSFHLSQYKVIERLQSTAGQRPKPIHYEWALFSLSVGSYFPCVREFIDRDYFLVNKTTRKYDVEWLFSPTRKSGVHN